MLTCYAIGCSCNATGQLYERTSKRAGSCFGIAALLWFLWIATQILNSTSANLMQNLFVYECEWWGCNWVFENGRFTTASVLASLAGLVALIGAVVSTFLLCVSRRSLRRRDHIPPGACGESCDDCCTTSLCACCSIVQMFRQEKMTGARYAPCTPSGELQV